MAPSRWLGRELWLASSGAGSVSSATCPRKCFLRNEMKEMATDAAVIRISRPKSPTGLGPIQKSPSQKSGADEARFTLTPRRSTSYSRQGKHREAQTHSLAYEHIEGNTNDKAGLERNGLMTWRSSETFTVAARPQGPKNVGSLCRMGLLSTGPNQWECQNCPGCGHHRSKRSRPTEHDEKLRRSSSLEINTLDMGRL